MRKTSPIDRYADFCKLLSNTYDENGVRNAYRIMMGIKDWEAPFNCDGYYNTTLYEFKSKKNLESKDGNKALAQACYYLRKFVNVGNFVDSSGQVKLYTPPLRVVVADENEALVISSKDLEVYFMSNNYDWSRAASIPDENLIKDISIINPIVYNIRTIDGLRNYLDAIDSIGSSILKIINRDNFDSIFQVWKKEFASNVKPQLAALCFLLDLDNKGIVNPNTGLVLFDFNGDTTNVRLRVPISVYQSFWSVYKRPPSSIELSAIYERKDRLVAMQHRRMEGEFFTPISYAKLAHDYIEKVIPDLYDNYTWWDCCCGTGNLTYHCPSGMRNLFMSTLNQEDVDICIDSQQNPNAHIFKYDFLNQEDSELPKELRDKLVPNSKWIFILNPPFATGNDLEGSFGTAGNQKTGISNTKIQDYMQVLKLNQACRNTYSQFMFRISQLVDAYNLDVHIALYSKGTFLTGTGFSKFRDYWYSRFEEVHGFVFPSWEFQGTSGKWPVVHTQWRSKS